MIRCGLAEDVGGRRVGDIVHRTFETVDASKPLDTAFSRQQQHPDELLLVTGATDSSDSGASMKPPICCASDELLLIAHPVR